MANTKRKIIIGALSVYLAGVAANVTSDSLQNVPILKYVSSALVWLYQQINAVILFKIQLWIPILILIVWYFLNKFFKFIKVSNEPDFLEYKSDVVKEWVWKWSYFINQSHQYQMSEMTPYCPKCDVQLRIDRSYTKARCVNCNKEWDTSRNYVLHDSPHRGEWEDYTDTLFIIQARVNNYKKKAETS